MLLQSFDGYVNKRWFLLSRMNLFIYESGPNHEKIEDVLFMQIH